LFMTSSGARRVAVPDGWARQADGDYASAFEIPVGERRFLTPEQWARATFEGAPYLLGLLLAFGWRFVLGLRLGPDTSPLSIAGWRIESSGSDALTLKADSPLLRARNTVRVSDSAVVVITDVHFERRTGRLLWAAVAPIHHRVMPFLLTRARG
jgi:hypothetical protein